MEEPRPRADIVRRVNRKSKRVSVNNLHLPPYPSEESLSRRARWYIDHPYLSTAIFVGLSLPLGFAVDRWVLHEAIQDNLIRHAISTLSLAISGLMFAHNRRRLYRRRYRRDE